VSGKLQNKLTEEVGEWQTAKRRHRTGRQREDMIDTRGRQSRGGLHLVLQSRTRTRTRTRILHIACRHVPLQGATSRRLYRRRRSKVERTSNSKLNYSKLVTSILLLG
jgi:hypothetical protein